MNCDESRELMLDILYGEELNSRTCFQFFQHIDACSECSADYGELLQTREVLQSWHVEDSQATAVPEPVPGRSARLRWIREVQWWPALTKVAAGFLILVGLLSILQNLGYLGGPRVSVSEQQLADMVQDMIVANQAEERIMIGRALIRWKDDADLQRNQDMQEVYDYLVTLEERYANNLEENNQYLRTLATK